jgi:hypothetical protein
MLRDDATAAMAAPNTLVLRIATQAYLIPCRILRNKQTTPLRGQDAARRDSVGLTRAFLIA